MRISLWDEILDLQARSTQPVPGTIILIKFIFVKDSIQCFLCTSCARLQRTHCTRRFASSIYRLASIVDIIRIDRAQFSILFLLPSGIVNEGKFVWINKRKWYRFLGIMGWYLWFVYLGHWFWILEEKSKYFFTFHIMFIIHIYMLHIYIYLWGVIAGVVRRESTINVEHHGEVVAQEVWRRRYRRSIWEKMLLEPNRRASPPLCIIINIVNNCKWLNKMKIKLWKYNFCICVTFCLF